MPIYYQGCKFYSPIKSGLVSLSLAVLAPASIIAGAIATRTQRYRPQMWFGWTLVNLGLGLYSMLYDNTNIAYAVGFNILTGAGIG